MKTILMTLFLFCWGKMLSAQENTTGIVIYEQVVQLEVKLEGEAAAFADMLPKERKSEKVLYFSPGAALYENGKSTADDLNMQAGGGNVMIRMTEPENKVFTDLENKKQVEQREFMTRVFIIEDEAAHQWKLTGNQKMILDYPCQEAVLEKNDRRVAAWFTPVIPVSAGPGNFCGLPGLILQVNIDEGKQIKTAKSVGFSPLSENILLKPEKGKKVTRDEFDKIVEEKRKETGAGQGEGARMMIQIHR
jgi:GLPGLI family protein